MAILPGLFLEGHCRELLERLENTGVPSAPVNHFEQVFADPHVRSRSLEFKIEHPFQKLLSLIRKALTFSGQAGQVPPP
ncbi:CoA transferase [Bradyrhizobium elkanii]|uniref:CoA transferase n=1 Tax=Bradyrhizobium elkanii TaxID=29448 RepID=UPI001BACF25F|nr:CoA transferase [Bradyrhizobium elkanii]